MSVVKKPKIEGTEMNKAITKINKIKPTKKKLKEWAGMTDRNCHTDRMLDVAMWAESNADEKNGNIQTFRYVREKLENVAMLHKSMGFLTIENCARRAELNEALVRLMRKEYGEQTAELISNT